MKLLIALLVLAIFVSVYFTFQVLTLMDEQSACIVKQQESGYTLDEAKDHCKR